MKRRRCRRFMMPEMVLTPLIDTALTLLVVFIVTSPMVQNGIKLNLPYGQSQEVSKEQDLVVSINKEGILFFNSYPVNRAELVDTVKKALVSRDQKPVYIRADEQVSYGTVIDIVDGLKMAGVRYVAMSTRPRA